MRHRARAVAALLILAARAAWAAGPDIFVEEDGFRPYGICAGTLRSAEGFSGKVEVRGRLYDGREVPLFRAELPGWTTSLDFRFIPDERVRTLFLAGHEYERELPAATGSEAEEAGRLLLGSLAPPFRSWAPGKLPGSVRFLARDPGDAGSRAARLFGRPGNPRAGWALCAYAAAVLGLLRFAGRMGRALRPALLALSAAACLGAAFLGLPGAVLFRLPLPDSRGPYDLALRPETARYPGYALVSFREDPGMNSGIESSLAILGARTPPGHSLPLSVFPGNIRLRFLEPPLVVTGTGGGFALRFEGFALGWALYE